MIENEAYLGGGKILICPAPPMKSLSIDMKRNPHAAWQIFDEEEAVLGVLPNTKFCILKPARPHASEIKGTHLFFAQREEGVVDFFDVKEEDFICFFDVMMPFIDRKGVYIAFNQAKNVVKKPISESWNKIHIHAEILDQEMPIAESELLQEQIVEPEAERLSELITWQLSRSPHYYLKPHGMNVDRERIQKTGFPSGGVVFAFEENTMPDSRNFYSFIKKMSAFYKIAQRKILETVFYEESLWQEENFRGDWNMIPMVRRKDDFLEQKERCFASDLGCPEKGREYIDWLYATCVNGGSNDIKLSDLDLVGGYTVAIFKEQERIKIALAPHFFKAGGTLETIGIIVQRDIVEGMSLTERNKRAELFANQLMCDKS